MTAPLMPDAAMVYAALLWAEKRSTLGRNLNWTTTDVAEAFRAGQAHERRADAGLLAALEGLLNMPGDIEFADVNEAERIRQERNAAWSAARAAIAAAKGTDHAE